MNDLIDLLLYCINYSIIALITLLMTRGLDNLIYQVNRIDSAIPYENTTILHLSNREKLIIDPDSFSNLN